MMKKCWQRLKVFLYGLAENQYLNQSVAFATVMSKIKKRQDDQQILINEWSSANCVESKDEWALIESTLNNRLHSLAVGLQGLRTILQDFGYSCPQVVVLIKRLCSRDDNGALLAKVVDQWLLLSQLDKFDDTSVPIHGSTIISTRKKQLITEVQMTLLTKCLPLSIDINELEEVLVESIIYKRNENFADSLMLAGQVKQITKQEEDKEEEEEEEEEKEEEEKEEEQLLLFPKKKKKSLIAC